ncbi:MAG: phosphomannomutase/phosphoglucomutase [Phycisphaerae bacterium]|nr:phosphomannomutase/phosphoglucomutase [Phycisphaerae bacterium]
MQGIEEYYRYCPGEEQVKLSNAVCSGRRRTNFPKCKGCQFNDDEKPARLTPADSAARRGKEKIDMLEKVFKAYDVRALYPDPLDAEVAWRIGAATAQFLKSQLRGPDRADSRAATLAIGRDMRTSSPELAKAFANGVRATGMNVIDVGMIDTSQIYFAVNHLHACGGVQTTASHNPAEYNGFKICGQRGKPIGSDTGLNEICKIAKGLSPHEATGNGTRTEQDLTKPYKQFVRQYLRTPRKMKVVIDASNGMAGRWFPRLFDDLDEIEIHPLNFEHNGEFVHPPNPLVDTNLVQLQDKVKRVGADFGVCFDGDADRLMLVDERAEIVRCDKMTAVLAEYFLKQAPGSTIVYDLRSSRILPEVIKKAGGTPRRERVGHAFMKRALSDSKGIFGGELSGHFYFKDNWFCDSGMLAFVHVVNVLTQSGRPLSELIKPLLCYAGSGERNFENEDKDGTIKNLARVYSDARIDFLDGITVQYEDWWFNVRPSNTEPLLRLNLEADTPELMEQKLAEVARTLGTPVAH